MTPITADCAFQHVEGPQDLGISTSVLVPASLADAAPWLYSALSQLHELQREARAVPGVGDLRITELASTQMRTVLALIDIDATLPTPKLYPVSGGGVGMKWNVGRREVEFTIFASGNAVAAKLDGTQTIDDSELTGNPRAHDDLNSYLGWLVGVR